MARKTSNDLRTEHNKLEAKLSALRSRIEDRCKQLVEKQPDVVIYRCVTDPLNNKVVSEVLENLWRKDLDTGERTEVFLDLIKAIEDHNEAKAGIVQTTMFPKNLK